MSLLQRTLVRTLVGAIALPTVIVVGSAVAVVSAVASFGAVSEVEWS